MASPLRVQTLAAMACTALVAVSERRAADGGRLAIKHVTIIVSVQRRG